MFIPWASFIGISKVVYKVFLGGGRGAVQAYVCVCVCVICVSIVCLSLCYVYHVHVSE